MPKRKRDKCNENEYDYLARKLRKLERKITRGRRHRTSSSDSDSPSLHNQRGSDAITAVDDDVTVPRAGCSFWKDFTEPSEQSDVEEHRTNLEFSAVAAQMTPLSTNIPAEFNPVTTTVQPPSATVAVPLPPAAAIQSDAPAPTEVVEQIILPTLDPDLLELLGEDPTSIKEYGDDIHNDLAIRLNHIATTGLNKESRKELKEKYLVPGNCKLIKAPGLNAEIRASLIESQSKRDKGIEHKQTLTSCALSSLSRAITLLLAANDKNQELLKMLMDTARILADVQHSDSMSRRYFVLSTVKKELKEQLEKTKIDEMLFGNSLAETLKSARTINKSGADLRSSSNFKASTQKSVAIPIKPLNARAPPVNRRPFQTGRAQGARPSFPAPAPRQTTTLMQQRGYKTSSRQQQPRQKR